MRCYRHGVATITLRLPDDLADAVRRHARADGQSMNAWMTTLVLREDMRRRCEAHEAWMHTKPQVADTALAFLRATQRALSASGLPNIAEPRE